MKKTVSSGKRMTTVNLDGTECEVVFSSGYNVFSVKSENEVTMALESGKVKDDDGVITIPAGESRMYPHMRGLRSIFITGSGKVEVFASNEAVNPFKSAPVNNGGVTSSGNPVQMDGLQGGVPFSEMVVSGKNLIGIAQAKVLGGNENSGYNVIDSPYSRTIIQKLQPNTTYTVKRYDSGNRFRIVLFNNEPSTAADITAKQLVINMNGSITEYTFTTDTAYLWFAFTTHSAASGDAVEPIVQLEYGSTPTEYEPPITGRELTVNVCGKNLLAYPYYNSTITINGITFTDNGDGTITVNGTANENVTYILSNKIVYKSNVNYVISGCPNTGGGLKFKGNLTGTNADDVGYGKTFSYKEDIECSVAILVYKNTTVENVVFRPQIELGNAATEYEPYQGSTTTITPDSNPYTIPNDIRQIDGLNNISVSEGEISVTGVKRNAAIKRIWNEIDEIKTAIIVSNGETE